MSKWKIYDFHHTFVKKTFNAELLITGIDSLVCEIKSEDIYKWKDLFDFSSYLKDSKFFDSTNKKVIGKIKDEFSGVIFDKFAGLKAEMY